MVITILHHVSTFSGVPTKKSSLGKCAFLSIIAKVWKQTVLAREPHFHSQIELHTIGTYSL